MKVKLLCTFLLISIAVSSSVNIFDNSGTVIIISQKAAKQETLAAKEVRRYIYQRTGELISIITSDVLLEKGKDIILIVRKDQPLIENLSDEKLKESVSQLAEQEYILKTIKHNDNKIVIITGGDETGTLYAAYHFVEHLGIRFYLHGDVIPDEKITLQLPDLDETGKPLFSLRGIQPFHDFPEGPDWWNSDDYKAIFSQLPKLRMNFFGLHTYPEGGVGPEPTVWIGLPQDIKENGDVKSSYPARHFTTYSGTWEYKAKNTSDFFYGSGQMFERNDYGADYMKDMTPWPNTPEDCNRMFDRAGNMLGEVFAYANKLGIKTCIGTETPLVIPKKVQERLKNLGKDYKDQKVIQELYEGMFEWVKKNVPLDYYWFWTPEGWTWSDTKEEDVVKTKSDFSAALQAAKDVQAPFTMATCGWVLGPKQDRALFDQFLPKEMPMSCINRNVGFSPVEPGFAGMTGRPEWAIPWLEDDPAMIIPQLWVGRMRRDAADALAYGCSGLMGIHWRTRILGPNVSALAQAGWEQEKWNPNFGKKATIEEANRAYNNPVRDLPAEDFYNDWVFARFGKEVAEPMAKLFIKLDGGELSEFGKQEKTNLPRPSMWTGPGGIKPDATPWKEAKKAYNFIEEMAQLRPAVKGKGNLSRFDYWLNNFYYLRAVHKFSCSLAEFNAVIEKVRKEPDKEIKKKMVRDTVLPVRKRQISELAEVHKYLLATVNTTGALGNVANWQQHNIPMYIEKPGRELADILGEDLPEVAMPSDDFPGTTRMFLPTVRTCLSVGEPLKLKVILLNGKPGDAGLYWRPMGGTNFNKKALKHINRGVYSVTLSSEDTKIDLEYYVKIVTERGEKLLFPTTAPALNQTVVIME